MVTNVIWGKMGKGGLSTPYSHRNARSSAVQGLNPLDPFDFLAGGMAPVGIKPLTEQMCAAQSKLASGRFLSG